MNQQIILNRLPTRLRRALWIWSSLGLLMCALPASAAASVGWLAEPAFWWVLLPCMGLAPFAISLSAPVGKKISPVVRRRRTGAQARRRVGGRDRIAQAA